MQIKVKLSFKYQNSNEAQIALRSLNPDNMGFVDSYNVDNSLVCNLNGDSFKTVIATADDLLFCQMMVEKILKLISDN